MPRPIVRGQLWTELQVPGLGTWQPRDRVTVVLPARDNQVELDRTLAALDRQSYPPDLMEVVVVDDASATPLVVPLLAPPGTRIVRRDEVSSHGSGAARHSGAQAGSGEILLFLDSDMIADRRHVEAHARWHHATDAALVLGHKWFVDVDGITPREVWNAAAGEAGIGGLLNGRLWESHDWQEEHIASRDGLTLDDDDTFLVVVGATVSVRREFYERSGGFSCFGMRGIVDTEFGYRAFTRGAVIIPEKAAQSWHQGSRSFSLRGGQIKRARMGLAANYLPLTLFRPNGPGRQWAVPHVHAVVDATPADGLRRSDEDVDHLLLTVDSILGSDLTDCQVSVVNGGLPLPQWWRDYFAHEHRVSEIDKTLDNGFPSPITAWIPPGVLLSTSSLRNAIELLSSETRLIETLPDAYRTPSVQFARTRTLERLRGADRDVSDEIAGRRWCVPSALGIRRTRPRTTAQGMVTTW